MNIERLEHLALWLEGGAKHERVTFDMTTGGTYDLTGVEELSASEIQNTCNTACCIAGAAVQFFNKPEKLIERELERIFNDEEYALNGMAELDLSWNADVFPEAVKLLDLDELTALRLFTPNEGVRSGHEANLGYFNDADWAARTIRHLVATGEVDWKATQQ